MNAQEEFERMIAEQRAAHEAMQNKKTPLFEALITKEKKEAVVKAGDRMDFERMKSELTADMCARIKEILGEEEKDRMDYEIWIVGRMVMYIAGEAYYLLRECDWDDGHGDRILTELRKSIEYFAAWITNSFEHKLEIVGVYLLDCVRVGGLTDWQKKSRCAYLSFFIHRYGRKSIYNADYLLADIYTTVDLCFAMYNYYRDSERKVYEEGLKRGWHLGHKDYKLQDFPMNGMLKSMKKIIRAMGYPDRLRSEKIDNTQKDIAKLLRSQPVTQYIDNLLKILENK